MSKSDWKGLLQVAEEGVRDVRVELRDCHAQCKQASKMVSNSLGTVTSLRNLCQKWSKDEDKSDTKALLGEYTLLLTELVLKDLVNLPNNISNEDIIDKYSKVLSFSVANISKVYQSIDTSSNINNLINLIQSLNDFVSMRVINIHKVNTVLFISNENIMGRFILHYIQSLCQLIMRYRVNPNYDILMQHIATAIHQYYIYDNKLDIIKSALTNEQVLAAVSYIVDSIWLLTLKLDTLKTFSSTEMVDSMRNNIIHTYFSYNTQSKSRLTCTRILDTMIQHFQLLLRQQLHSKAISLIKQGVSFISYSQDSVHSSPLFDSNSCNRFVLWLLEVSSKVQIPELYSTELIDVVGVAWNHSVELARKNAAKQSLDWNILLTICTIETYIYSTRLRVHATAMYPMNDEVYHGLVSSILDAGSNATIDTEDVAYVEILAKLYASCLNYEILYAKSDATTATVTTKLLHCITRIFTKSRENISESDAIKRTNNVIKISNALTRSFITGLNIIQNIINESSSNQHQHGFAMTVVADIIASMTQCEVWNGHSVPSILTVLKSLSNTANTLLGPVPLGAITSSITQLLRHCASDSSNCDAEAVVVTLVILLVSKASVCQQYRDVTTSIAAFLPSICHQFQTIRSNQDVFTSYRRLLTMHINALVKQLDEVKSSGTSLLHAYLDSIVASEQLCHELMEALTSEVVAPTPSSKSNAEEMYLFIETFFEYFTSRKASHSAYVVKEAQINRLYLLSHLLWSGRVGISSEYSKGVISTLRDYGNEYDGVSMSIINRTKKGKKVVSGASALAGDDILALRVWILLAQWAFPAINTSKSEIAESDGFQGTCIYLSNAVKSLKNISTSHSSSDSRDATVAADARVLYHMLGLHGRLEDQLKVVTYVRDMVRSNASIHSAAKAVYGEIAVLYKVGMVWNSYGDQRICSDDIVGDVSALSCDSWLAGVNTYVTKVAAIFNNSEVITEVDFDNLSEGIFNLIPASKRASGPSQVLLKSWVCLLAGKVFLYHFSAHRPSYTWIRKGLNILIPLNDAVLGPGFTLDVALPRLEGVLLLAEVHEQCGNIDSTLAYVSEAFATSKIGSNALYNTVSLHCMRIWYRMDSARFSLALQELCQVDGDSSDMEQLYDDVSKSIKKAARCLSALLLVNEDDVSSDADADSMRFRHVGKSWDLTWLKGLAAQGTVASNPFGAHNTNIPDELRGKLSHLFNGNSTLEEYIRVLKQLEGSYCFDVIRSVRRRTCVDIASGIFGENLAISPSASVRKSMLSFVLGVASCGISTECLLEKESTKRGIVTETIRNACVGETAAIADIFRQFDSLLRGGSGSSNYQKICFLTLEESSGALVMGAYAGISPEVVALPIGKTIMNVLTRWNELMSRSKDNLQKTMDVEKVNKWSDEEKRNWWNNRKKSDEEIAEVLAQIESLLGSHKDVLLPCKQGDLDQLVSATKALTIDTKSKKATKTLANTCSSSGVDPGIPQKKTEEELRLLKVTELKEMLKEAGLSTKGAKEELVDRLANYYNNHDVNTAVNSKAEDGKQQHVLLILDEKLQGIPWECLPSFRYVCCSRLPSLNLLLQGIHTISSPSALRVEVQPTEAWDENTMAVANTRERKKSKGTKVDVQATPSIKVNSCWYAVDPENNLPNTRATMQGFLEPYTAKYKWRGYIGEAPPPADIKSYHDSCDLFIYCGHGAGEKLIDSKAIKKSTTCPASLLWGCSSGKLVVHGIHDPVGAALSYLIGGAPYVLGNLWDVTDKDIDRLTIQCMSSYLDSVEESEGIRKDTSICDSLVKARDCCKLKYAVGSAPIIYGISLPLK